MTRRERVLKALEFQQPDLTPYDIGLTWPLRKQAYAYFGTEDLGEAFGNHLYSIGVGSEELWTEPKPGLRRDEFGVVWDRTIDQDIGTTTTDLVIPEPTLVGYTWPDPLEARRFADLERYAGAAPDQFVVADFGFTLFERAWTMRGMENVLMDMAANERFTDEFLDAICDWNIEVVKRIVKYPVDAVLFGDDWGCQRGLIMGPKLWRRFIKPRIARMYKEVTDAGRLVFIHSCGDVDELFDDLVEAGVRVFNPFQPEVMDTFALAKKYKGRLAFYGGISTQRLLPYSTPDQVRAGVRNIIKRIGKGGGYIAAPAHATPKDTPFENILAMWEVLRAGR